MSRVGILRFKLFLTVLLLAAAGLVSPTTASASSATLKSVPFLGGVDVYASVNGITVTLGSYAWGWPCATARGTTKLYLRCYLYSGVNRSSCGGPVELGTSASTAGMQVCPPRGTYMVYGNVTDAAGNIYESAHEYFTIV